MRLGAWCNQDSSHLSAVNKNLKPKNDRTVSLPFCYLISSPLLPVGTVGRSRSGGAVVSGGFINRLDGYMKVKGVGGVIDGGCLLKKSFTEVWEWEWFTVLTHHS